MASESLTPEIRQFIARYIHAVEHMEVLCLLSDNPQQPWSVADVFRQVQSSEKSIAECLASFCAMGLATSDQNSTFRLSRENPDQTRLAASAVQAYRERRVSVTECIYAKPSDAIQDFADAFRLRKEK